MNPGSKKGRRLGESEVLLKGFLSDRIAMEALRETIGSRPKEVIGVLPGGSSPSSGHFWAMTLVKSTRRN